MGVVSSASAYCGGCRRAIRRRQDDDAAPRVHDVAMTENRDLLMKRAGSDTAPGRRTATVSPATRKALLTVHVLLSVGWIGAVFAYLALNIVALTSPDDTTVRGAYLLMDPVLRYCITPLGIGSLVTGIALGLGTRWGLLKHRWVVASLWLTAIAVAIMIAHIFTDVAELSERAANPALDPRTDRADLPHTIASIIWLSVVMVLNIYKPRGLTKRGRRLQARSSAERVLAT